MTGQQCIDCACGARGNYGIYLVALVAYFLRPASRRIESLEISGEPFGSGLFNLSHSATCLHSVALFISDWGGTGLSPNTPLKPSRARPRADRVRIPAGTAIAAPCARNISFTASLEMVTRSKRNAAPSVTVTTNLPNASAKPGRNGFREKVGSTARQCWGEIAKAFPSIVPQATNRPARNSLRRRSTAPRSILPWPRAADSTASRDRKAIHATAMTKVQFGASNRCEGVVGSWRECLPSSGPDN